MNLPRPKLGHTTGGSRRGARRGGGAGSGRTVCQQNCSPREQSFLALSKASKTRRLNVTPEVRTSEILCEPMEEQNPRLTTVSSAVYQRFITRTRNALSSWLPTSGTTPFCFCKLFSCKACPGTDGGTKPAVDVRFITGTRSALSSWMLTRGPMPFCLLNPFHARHVRENCRVQNSDIPRAGHVKAHDGVAGRDRAGLGANRTVRVGDKPLSYPPKHRRQVA